MLECAPRQASLLAENGLTNVDMELSVVVLNWNAADDTIRCVTNIAAWRRVRSTVFVVDNASKDNSADTIGQACPGINLICNEDNLGFAGGTNQGITSALSLGNTPILLLNNDAIIEEKDVARLLNTLAENHRIGIIGPLLFDADHQEILILISAGGRNPILHHHTRVREVKAGQVVQRVAYVSGTAVIIRPEVFRVVGLLDERYFFSTELADLCMRAEQGGYLSAVDTRARAYHRVSRSVAMRDTLFVYYIVRNRFIFIRNSSYKVKLPFYIFWTIYSLVLSLKLYLSGRMNSARAVWLGLVDGLQGRFGGQNERVLRPARDNTSDRR
jgi:GT2 family glycosyltransferase